MSADRLDAAWASLGKAGRDGIVSAVIDAAYRIYERAGVADHFLVEFATGFSLNGAKRMPDGSLRFGSRNLLIFWTPQAGFFIVGGEAYYPDKFLNAFNDETAVFDLGQDTLLGHCG